MSDINTHNTHNTHDSPGSDEVRAKMLHMLEVYPQISTSMLQVAMNPWKASDWKPVLEELIEEGQVRRFQHHSNAPSGRLITRTVIQAANPALLAPPKSPSETAAA